jgi:hypothetical protein
MPLRHPPPSHQQEASLVYKVERHSFSRDQVGAALSAAA